MPSGRGASGMSSSPLPAHQEEVTDGHEASLGEQRALADLGVLGERRELDANERVLA